MVLNSSCGRKVHVLHSSTEPLEVVLGAYAVHLLQLPIKIVKHATRSPNARRVC